MSGARLRLEGVKQEDERLGGSSVPWLYPSPFLLTSDLPRSLLIALSSRSPAKSNSCRNRLSTLAQKAPACWLRYSLLFSLDRLWLD